MKNNIKISILLSLFILVFACKKNEFLDLIVAGEHPFGNTLDGDIYKSYEFDSVKTILIKVPKFSEWNIFYKKAGKETFLTNYCHSDCNEQLNKYEWSKNGVYFAMLIEGSNRYPNSTRLFLFDFNDEVAKRKIDVKDKKIKSFRFEEKAFYYTDDKDVELKINL